MNSLKKVNAVHVIDVSKSVKKTGYNTKIEEIEKKISNHDKYITTTSFNKFSGVILDEGLKQAESGTKDDIADFD